MCCPSAPPYPSTGRARVMSDLILTRLGGGGGEVMLHLRLSLWTHTCNSVHTRHFRDDFSGGAHCVSRTQAGSAVGSRFGVVAIRISAVCLLPLCVAAELIVMFAAP